MTNLKNPDKKQLRNFGFLIGLGLPLVIGYLVPLIGGHDFRKWTLLISVPSLILQISHKSLNFLEFYLINNLYYNFLHLNSHTDQFED